MMLGSILVSWHLVTHYHMMFWCMIFLCVISCRCNYNMWCDTSVSSTRARVSSTMSTLVDIYLLSICLRQLSRSPVKQRVEACAAAIRGGVETARPRDIPYAITFWGVVHATSSYISCHTYHVIHIMSYSVSCHTYHVIHIMAYVSCHTYFVLAHTYHVIHIMYTQLQQAVGQRSNVALPHAVDRQRHSRAQDAQEPQDSAPHGHAGTLLSLHL
jgi:hypothetical protein